MRTLLPSSSVLKPTRAGLLQRVQISMTSEMAMLASRSMSPACFTCALALLCVFINKHFGAEDVAKWHKGGCQSRVVKLDGQVVDEEICPVRAGYISQI